MKKIDFTSNSGGFPLTNLDLNVTQNQAENNFAEFLKGLSTDTTWILNGLVETALTISLGAVVKSNVIYPCLAAFTFTTIGNVYIVSDYLNDLDGVKTFKDGSSHNTYTDNNCKMIESATTPTGYSWYVLYSSVIRLEDAYKEKIGESLGATKVVTTDGSSVIVGSSPLTAHNKNFGIGATDVETGSNNPSSLITKKIDIGDWDMATDSALNLAWATLGTTIDKVVGFVVMIRNDDDTSRRNLNDIISTIVAGTVSASATLGLVLYRTASQLFDTTDYDSTSYNRGYVILTLLP